MVALQRRKYIAEVYPSPLRPRLFFRVQAGSFRAPANFRQPSGLNRLTGTQILSLFFPSEREMVESERMTT
jgi:hypothetical protein